MKNWFLHILLLAGLFGVLTTSCSQDADDPTMDSRSEKEKVMIRFTIAMDEPKTASRSWEGYDPDSGNEGEVGSVSENFIDASKVQVLVYDMDGILMGELKELAVQPNKNDDIQNNKHLYDLTGAFEADADQVSSLDFKLMVFANTAKQTNLNNPNSWSFNYPLVSGAGIPMWGIATFEDVDLSTSTSAGSAKKLNTPIYMLRSMAKIEVTLSTETAENYTLTGVSLNKAMKNGLVMPKLRASGGTADMAISALSATTTLGRDEVFNPVTGDTQEASFTGKNNTYYIYVPDYDASETDDLEITLNIGNDKPTKSFKHGQYSNSNGQYSNTAWDVVRNHYYKYTVTINDGTELELDLKVTPWNLQQQVVNYKDVPGTTAGGMISFGNDSEERKNNNDEVVGYDVKLNTTKLSTTCTFTLNSPLGYRWIASLVPMGEGNSAANCPFTFVMNGANVGLETSDIINGQEVTLTIATTATEGVEDNKEALLQIIVIKGDGTSVVLPKDIIGGPYYIMQTK